MSNLTNNELQILQTLADILESTECVYSIDLVEADPRRLRGALSSLIRKGIIEVDDEVDGTGYYPVYYWDEDVLASI